MVTGKHSDVFHGVVQRFSYLRRFAPAFLRALDFIQEAEGATLPCFHALEVLKTLNDEHKRKLPDDAPTDFLPAKLRPLVTLDDGTLDKQSWECALLMKLRDDIKAGNAAVRHSKRFGRLDDFFIPDHQWHAMREAFFQRAGLPLNPSDAPDYLQERLGQAYDQFFQAVPTNSYATVDNNSWRLSTDPSESLEAQGRADLERLKGWLAKHMRSIRLPELLIEVDNELSFTQHFMTTAQQHSRNPDDVCLILAAILAHGCNIGPYIMAQLTSGVSYRQLKRVTDWQLTEEAQRHALASLVHAIARLDTALGWGEGRTSASDGQRFALPRKVLQQTYSSKFSDPLCVIIDETLEPC